MGSGGWGKWVEERKRERERENPKLAPARARSLDPEVMSCVEIKPPRCSRIINFDKKTGTY